MKTFLATLDSDLLNNIKGELETLHVSIIDFMTEIARARKNIDGTTNRDDHQKFWKGVLKSGLSVQLQI